MTHDAPRHVDVSCLPDDWREQDPKYDRLKPLSISELEKQPCRRHLIKGLLGAGEMSIWFGEPGCGKSFLMLHTSFCIAQGQPWFGRRVTKGPVLYIATEGGAGIINRVKVIRGKQPPASEPDVNFINVSVDLLRKNADVQPIADRVKKLGCVLIVVDTLSRALSGGDENGPGDMGRFIANIDQIRERTGAHVAIVHHSPKGEKTSPRGHSSLLGAADTCVKVEKLREANIATVTKNKDDKEGWAIWFSLDVKEVGIDDDGDPITSCIVVPSNQAPAPQEKRLTGDKARAMGALHDVLTRRGCTVHETYGIPDGAICAEEDAWRQEFYARKNGNQAAKQKAFKRAMSDLQDLGQIGYRDGLVWVADPNTWKGESA